jgi:hypothetical protein
MPIEPCDALYPRVRFAGEGNLGQPSLIEISISREEN